MPILYMLLSLTVFLLPPMLLLIPSIRLWVHNRRWIPGGSVRSPFIRRTEAVLLFLMVTPVAMLWLYQGHDAEFIPRAFSTSVADNTRNVLQWGLIVTLAGLLVAAVLAWRVSTSWAAAVLACGLLGGQFYVQQVLSAQFREATQPGYGDDEPQELSDLPPIRIRFELPDNLAGADLWVNGVHLGKTPHETTVQDLLEQVPTWTHEEQRAANDEDRYESWTYDARGHHGSWMDRWGWCPLNLPNSVPRPHESIYYKVDLAGLTGYSRVAQQRSMGRRDSPDHFTLIELDTEFPEWEDQIEELLDRARLADYAVPPEWLAAFGSFETPGSDRLNTTVNAEPGFNRVLDDWARQKYSLDSVNNPDDAWQVLLQIQEETRNSGEYASDSLAGRAVDLLVPHLDPEQLIGYAIHLLETTPNPAPGSWQGGSGDPPLFRTYQHDEPARPEVLALWPIAHAVWRMDRQIDEESAGDDSGMTLSASNRPGGQQWVSLETLVDARRDNMIEQQITPALLRLCYREVGRLRFASVLGGSDFEKFLVRQPWRAPVDEYGSGIQHIGKHDNTVNQWFYELMWLRGPVGREFRRQNESRLLELARNSVEDFDLMTGSLPTDLGFLFVDREWTADDPSLAMRFWEDVDQMAKLVPDHSHEQALRMRWDYLGRLWPESTIEMFVEAYSRQQVKGRLSAVLPESIDPSDQAEIYATLLEFEDTRKELLPDDGSQSIDNPSYAAQLNRGDLQQRLFDLPCEASALMMLDQLRIDPEGSVCRNLPERMQVDTLHDDLVRVLAESGEPELQQMALTAIEHHPTPERRAVLTGLLEADDEQVREAAIVVQQELLRLAERPLPRREIPVLE